VGDAVGAGLCLTACRDGFAFPKSVKYAGETYWRDWNMVQKKRTGLKETGELPTTGEQSVSTKTAMPVQTSVADLIQQRKRLAVELYAQREVSQEVGAVIAGVTRGEFLNLLAEAKVPAFQYDIEEDFEEAMRVYNQRMGDKF
jgi:predicted HTH domain antitoxin